MTVRRAVRSGWFVALVCLAWLACHAWRLDDGPTGFHEWREADTCSVAWQLYRESFDLLHPRIAVRGDGDGVVGQEFPALNAAIAVGWMAFGPDQHWWARSLSLIAAIAIMLALRRLMLDLGLPRLAASAAVFAAACSPLLFFYGRKIIPDVPALALALWGAVLARRWIVGTGGIGTAGSAAALLALAGLIKPIALSIGLPLAADWLRHRGWGGLARPAPWLFGLAVLAPMIAWFAHARSIGSGGHFLLQAPWQASLEALRQGQPLVKLLVEWPWQLWIGIPLIPAFLIGAWRARRVAWLWWWLAGAFAALLPFAAQFGPHDYYTVIAVPACAALAGIGVASALAHPRRWIAGIMLALMAAAGPAAFSRIVQRYGPPYDHAAIRRLADRHLPPDALVVAYDGVPATLLYRLARPGWWLSEEEQLASIPILAHRGATHLAARDARAEWLAARYGPPLFTSDGISVWRISLDLDRGDQRSSDADAAAPPP